MFAVAAFAESQSLAAAMTLIEIRPHARSWKVFEARGVEPVFQAKAIGVLQSFTASELLP
jgi:hypothetical protein